MRSSKIILGASALVLGVASAFTAKTSNAYFTNSKAKVGTNGACVPFTTLCNTGTALTNFTDGAGSGNCTVGKTVFTSASTCQANHQLKLRKI